ncbi:hypothetical protein [Nannocystis bainbridge]|uniref:Uncharacterized protein n=1 Tax=Nannocystis bainbridge TaxID=2995303 RepID=A0ABT5ED47_9BACT|nr:hypothetical protein [Nannocystis bainbridge]MDC0723249.1 hypothetical protein [Nannocystis bainbridge]
MRFAPPALLVSLLVGCGGEAPPPPPAPVQAPAPAPAPEPEAPPPPSGRVLLVASEFGLSPLACYLDASQQFAGGADCLVLAPEGTEVWLMSGAPAKVVGRAVAACPGVGEPEPTLVIDAPPEALRGDALVPASLKGALVYVTPTPPPEADRDAPAELRARIAETITAAAPGLKVSKLRIDQHARLDLDGDGSPEALVAAVVPDPKDAEANLRFSGLFLVPASGAPVLLRSRVDTRERYALLGALDLDGDGPRELYLNTYGDDGFSLSLESRGPSGLQSLGRWACG